MKIRKLLSTMALSALVASNAFATEPVKVEWGDVIRQPWGDPSDPEGANVCSWFQWGQDLWFDYNNDGYPDRFLIGGKHQDMGHAYLFRNEEGSEFTNIPVNIPKLEIAGAVLRILRCPVRLSLAEQHAQKDCPDLLFLSREQPLPVIIFLDQACSARAAEVVENPGGHALDVVNVPQRCNLFFVHIRLALLGSFVRDGSMVIRQRVCAELRYDNRLVRLAVFHQCRQHRKIRGVPAAVLVDADDVKVFHQTVLNLIFRSINQAGRRHHSRLILPMRAFCQCAHEFQPFIRIGILISDRPDDHARAVPVTVDEFANGVCGLPG